MPRQLITSVLVVLDTLVVILVSYLALFIRFDWDDLKFVDVLTANLPIITSIRLVTFYMCGLYNRIWRYASVGELLAIISAVSVSSAVIITYIYFVAPDFPKSVLILAWLLNILFIGASRLFIRIIHYLRKSPSKGDKNVLIIGADDDGAMIARELQNSRFLENKKLIGFIDDDKQKLHQHLFGVKVLGCREDIAVIVSEHDVNEIIIAMPSADGSVIREILNNCKRTRCTVKILPGIYNLIDGKISIQQLRDVNLEDLLRRDPIKLDLGQIAQYLTGKRILVTGAGGSIGSELCRQIAQMTPKSLILLGKGENSIYEVHHELQGRYPKMSLHAVIADIRDSERINSIFMEYRPQVVFHAAAHKHVPLMELQPIEAVRNNIFGTKTVAEATDRVGSEIFVMVSTDKAVNPTSIMGATKRVAELVIQKMNRISTTKYVAVRFGNVLGSRGSVIPLFRKQIAEGGPVTITHPDMVRYFMTIPEAVQLVLQAGSLAKGGELFVLDMGKPVKIVDMACDLIELSGLVPHKDVVIQYTGLRPGEKLFEELLTAEEGTASTRHEKIYVANLKEVDEEELQRVLLALQSAKYPEEAINVIRRVVPTYVTAREKLSGVETLEVKPDEKRTTSPGLIQYQGLAELHYNNV